MDGIPPEYTDRWREIYNNVAPEKGCIYPMLVRYVVIRNYIALFSCKNATTLNRRDYV